MKMINAGTANIKDYPQYVYNCNTLGTCKRPYMVPLPTFADMQLYVYFGSSKPATLEFTVYNRCNPTQSTIVTSSCFIIGHTGEGWYGVFNKFTPLVTYPSFVVGLKVVFENESPGTFFSEEFSQLSACDKLTKLEVCYPSNYNAEDINGIYIGKPSEEYDTEGAADLIYQHRYWVRDAEVIEMQNKLTFTANSKKNFATTVNKIFEFRPELVPGWYKDYLLAVYFRGNFSINGVNTKASDFSGENILEEADLWTPYVKIDKELKGAFGCAPIVCDQICPDVPCVPVTMELGALPEALVGVAYEYIHAITGTPAFTLNITSKPDWMTITVAGTNIVFSGTPDEGGVGVIEFVISNACGEQTISADYEVNETEAYLVCNNYFIGSEGDGITDVCTLGFNWERSIGAQQDAEDDGVTVKCTVYVEMDNGCSTEVEVTFLPNETIVAVHNVNLNCNGNPCSAIVDIHCVNLEIVE